SSLNQAGPRSSHWRPAQKRLLWSVAPGSPYSTAPHRSNNRARHIQRDIVAIFPSRSREAERQTPCDRPHSPRGCLLGLAHGLSKKARRNFRRAQVRGVKNQKLNFAPSCSTRGSYVDVTFPKFGSAELVLTPKNWVWLKVLNDSNRN